MTFFSVIIPVFNRVAPLQRALESVATQDFTNFEVIVVDDGSTGEYAAKIAKVIQQVELSNCHLIRYEKNINGSHARNIGIQQAVGEYICLLDSDDSWYKNKLSFIHRYIQEYQSQFVYHQCELESGQLIPSKGIGEHEAYMDYTFVNNKRVGAPTSTIVLLRELATRHPFDSSLSGHQDWDFCLNLKNAGIRFDFIELPLCRRFQSNIDSVGRSITFDFSMTFFKQRRNNFSMKAAIHFHWLTLLPKAIKEFRIFQVFKLSGYFWLLFLTPNAAGLMDVLKGLSQNYKLKRRLQIVKHKTRNADNQVIIFGNNYYAQLLHDELGSKVEAFVVSVANQSKFMGKPLWTVDCLKNAKVADISAIVLATDHHQVSMIAALNKQQSGLDTKVIYF